MELPIKYRKYDNHIYDNNDICRCRADGRALRQTRYVAESSQKLVAWDSWLTSSSKGGVFPFELEQFLVREEVGRV